MGFSELQKQRIIELKLGGKMSIRAVARAVGCSAATVKRVVSRWRSGAGLRRRTGSGRPSRLDRELSDRLSNLIISRPNASSTTLAHHVNIHRAHPLTDRSIRTYRRALGFHPVHTRRAPRLITAHKAKRLAFCKQHQHDDVHGWVFSDEAGVEADSDGSIYWIKRGEERPIVERSSHPVRVNFWAMIWWDGWSEPVFYDEAMNAEVFLDVLQKHAAPHLAGQPLILLQDLATWHRAHAVRAYLNEANINVLDDFPPASPDLNAIEYVWGWVKAHVGRSRPHTAADLKRAIRAAWRALPLDTMRGFIDRIPNVMREIIAAQGAHSK
jgi:transposase